MDNHSWLVSVIDDLRVYAEKNDLLWLRQELSAAKLTAMAEIGCEAEDLSPSFQPTEHAYKYH